MRGTIFKNKDRKPPFATINPNLNDNEILEIERGLIEDGYKPIANPEEYLTNISF